jgi:hypothetical protein
LREKGFHHGCFTNPWLAGYEDDLTFPSPRFLPVREQERQLGLATYQNRALSSEYLNVELETLYLELERR